MQEFDPAEFYDLMEAAECRAREVVQVDVPQYILSKLGLAATTPPDARTYSHTLFNVLFVAQSILFVRIQLECKELSFLSNAYIQVKICTPLINSFSEAYRINKLSSLVSLQSSR